MPWKKEVQFMGKTEGQANLALLNMVKHDIAKAKAQGNPDVIPDSLCKLLLEMREKENSASERDALLLRTCISVRRRLRYHSKHTLLSIPGTSHSSKRA